MINSAESVYGAVLGMMLGMNMAAIVVLMRRVFPIGVLLYDSSGCMYYIVTWQSVNPSASFADLSWDALCTTSSYFHAFDRVKASACDGRNNESTWLPRNACNVME